MIEKLFMEKETIYMSLETGEVVDSHTEAIKLYREGADIQLKYRYRYDGDSWSNWNDGPTWVH